MRFASVCSGIDAPSVAWPDWESVFFSEIEPFPCAVLKHHYPQTQNLGDMLKFKDWPDYAIDVLIGGTPCQAFSVAGLRKGLDDPRGNLTLTFLGVIAKYRPRWVVWENVPGVLSDKTGAFGIFLHALGQLGYGFAYRVLDAQFYGVPQRRRRVFVAGHIGGLWKRAAAVLFEPESLRGDSPPSREAGEGTTGTLSARTKGVGGLGTDFDCQGGVIGAVSAKWSKGSGGPAGDECQNLIAHSLKAAGFDASEDGTGRGTPLITAIQGVQSVREKKQNGIGISEGGPMYSLTKRDQHAIAFTAKDYGQDAGDMSPTLRGGQHNGSHANGGVMPAIALPLTSRVDRGGEHREAHGNNLIAAKSAVRRLTPRECERLQGLPDDYTLVPVRKANVKAEVNGDSIRLIDGYKVVMAADGPRYKAIGNSMAVPVIRWIGRRIELVDAINQPDRLTA